MAENEKQFNPESTSEQGKGTVSGEFIEEIKNTGDIHFAEEGLDFTELKPKDEEMWGRVKKKDFSFQEFKEYQMQVVEEIQDAKREHPEQSTKTRENFLAFLANKAAIALAEKHSQ